MRSRSDALAGQHDRAHGEQAEPHTAEPRSATLHALCGRTILVADAHADTRELYTVYLKSAEAAVVDASDGRDALVKTFGSRPDAVVADAQLPFIDGVELCRLLRTDAATAQLPIVLVTANALSPAVDELWRAGADAAFTKPFPPESLIEELARLLRSPRAVQAAGDAASRDGGADSDGTATRDRRRRRVRPSQPFLAPPDLRCPMCDGRLQYQRSHAGGIGGRSAEQWDYFTCGRCGTFQYRHRTRKLRRVS